MSWSRRDQTGLAATRSGLVRCRKVGLAMATALVPYGTSECPQVRCCFCWWWCLFRLVEDACARRLSSVGYTHRLPKRHLRGTMLVADHMQGFLGLVQPEPRELWVKGLRVVSYLLFNHRPRAPGQSLGLPCFTDLRRGYLKQTIEEHDPGGMGWLLQAIHPPARRRTALGSAPRARAIPVVMFLTRPAPGALVRWWGRE